MAFSKTLAVFMCVVLASLAFVSQDVLAARGLAEANGGRMYRLSLFSLSFCLRISWQLNLIRYVYMGSGDLKGVYRGWPDRPGQPYGTRLPTPEGGYGGGGYGGGGYGGPPKTQLP
jgi:hypothetical protein